MSRIAHSKTASKQSFNYRYTHFYKDFLKGYGVATEEISNDALKRRLKSISCEFMKRPHIAISEFAETMSVNTSRIEKFLPPFSDKCSDVIKILKYVEGVSEGLNKFRVDGVQAASVSRNLKALLKLFCGRDATFNKMNPNGKADKLIRMMMHLGASMYLVGIHLTVSKFILNNLPWVRDEGRQNKETKFSEAYRRWLDTRSSSSTSLMGGYMDVAKEGFTEMGKAGRKNDCLDSSPEQSVDFRRSRSPRRRDSTSSDDIPPVVRSRSRKAKRRSAKSSKPSKSVDNVRLSPLNSSSADTFWSSDIDDAKASCSKTSIKVEKKKKSSQASIYIDLSSSSSEVDDEVTLEDLQRQGEAFLELEDDERSQKVHLSKDKVDKSVKVHKGKGKKARNK